MKPEPFPVEQWTLGPLENISALSVRLAFIEDKKGVEINGFNRLRNL